jgi:hypothetical protein
LQTISKVRAQPQRSLGAPITSTSIHLVYLTTPHAISITGSKMHFNAFTLLTALPLASAHFLLTWPDRRGFDDDKASGGPCGGFDTVSSNRTEFPLSGGPVQLDMHHTQTKVAVYLALGNSPSADDFTITLVPTLSEEGPSNFCLGSINIPSNLNISAGTNGTIQVVTNGDPSGGLYQVNQARCHVAKPLLLTFSQCGDVTFVDTTLSSSDYDSHCQNSTGVRVTQENMSGQPNGTTSGGTSASSPSSSPSSTPGAATRATAGAWAVGAAGMAAFALL